MRSVLNVDPFPVLTTAHLVLRQLEARDDKDIFLHRSDDRVNTYLENFRHSEIAETQAFISRVQKETAEGRTILWALTEKGKNRFIGTVCLWNISECGETAETGYTLDPAFHGKGYMNEALVRIIDFGFNTLKLKTIEAYTHEDNSGSIKLLQKNKFKQGQPMKAEAGTNRIFFSLDRTPSAEPDIHF